MYQHEPAINTPRNEKKRMRPELGVARMTGTRAVMAAVVLIAASGAVRIWQTQRLNRVAVEALETPIPLSELPLKLGAWQATGEELALDSRTVQVAGCTDYVARQYIDERTGVSLLMLIAFGPAEKIGAHTPLVCFPAVGYAPEAGAQDVPVIGSSAPGRFRLLVFNRSEPKTERLEVLYTFRHAGVWTPNADENRKQFRHQPSMFKIQIQRRIAERERFGRDDPLDQFLASLIPEFERSLIAKRRAAAHPLASASVIPRGCRRNDLAIRSALFQKRHTNASHQIRTSACCDQQSTQYQNQHQRWGDEHKQHDVHHAANQVRSLTDFVTRRRAIPLESHHLAGTSVCDLIQLNEGDSRTTSPIFNKARPLRQRQYGEGTT
jgi:hypothetical protein